MPPGVVRIVAARGRPCQLLAVAASRATGLAIGGDWAEPRGSPFGTKRPVPKPGHTCRSPCVRSPLCRACSPVLPMHPDPTPSVPVRPRGGSLRAAHRPQSHARASDWRHGLRASRRPSDRGRGPGIVRPTAFPECGSAQSVRRRRSGRSGRPRRRASCGALDRIERHQPAAPPRGACPARPLASRAASSAGRLGLRSPGSGKVARSDRVAHQAAAQPSRTSERIA